MRSSAVVRSRCLADPALSIAGLALIVAGFLESFVTRHSPVMYPEASASIILASLVFIIVYFVVYPYHVERRFRNA